jgi:DNA-binding XRE family transcriptional regulator
VCLIKEGGFLVGRFIMVKNGVRKFRESLLLSKAELARKAGLSPLTIDRIEKGKSCRPETKRKVLLALGLKLSDKDKVFF